MARNQTIPTTTGEKPCYSIRGRVTSVNTKTYSVTVLTDQEGRLYENVQVMSPYWHYMGEGFFALPDLDARVMIGIFSDDTPPMVTGFLDIPSLATPSEQSAEEGLSEPQPGNDEAEISFSGGRPRAYPGDFGFRGRDGNFLYFRKGGTLQEGSSGFCQRIYTPIRNTIQDYAENYSLATIGGDLLFESDRVEDSDDASAGFRVKLLVNKNLEDKKASVLLSMGKVGEDTLVRLALEPNGIDRSQATTTSPVVDILFKESGKVEVTTKDWTQTVNGTSQTTINGDDKLTVLGKLSQSATESEEIVTGAKKITAAAIQLSAELITLGGGGNPICGNADGLTAWLASHVHDPTTLIPTVPPPPIRIQSVTG